MILLNKTMMCGGLVVLAPGSPLQVLFAILIMLFHLLFVLKLGPYKKSSEDWSAFFSTLGLCLLSLGALAMLLDVEEQQMETIGLVTTVLPLVCIAVVVCIMIFVDGGLWKKLQGRTKRRVGKTNVLKVVPIQKREQQPIQAQDTTLEALKSWGGQR